MWGAWRENKQSAAKAPVRSVAVGADGSLVGVRASWRLAGLTTFGGSECRAGTGCICRTAS